MRAGDSAVGRAADAEAFRAALYALLSTTLIRPPPGEFLAQLRALEGDETPLGNALSALAEAARRSPEEIADEYTLLFYGQGQGGEVLPYASYYLTGNLHDRPLAELRRDMDRLGIAREDVITEPEDHVAILLEIMHGIVTGQLGPGPADLAAQHGFYAKHLAPWATDFFADLEAADSAAFYVAVARLGRAFLTVEEDAFQMAA